VELGGVAEIAEALGVSRQRLAKLRERPDFPPPIAELAQGPIWNLHIIRGWAGSGVRSHSGRPRSEVVERTLGGRFVLEEQIGSGGFADVWRAIDRKYSSGTPQIVAVKVLRNVHLSEPDYVARFRRELQLMEKFDHPHVMKVLASGDMGDEAIWFAMPLAQQSLADVIEEFQDKPATITDLIGQVCAGLAYIHDKGVLHRDLKPGNILRKASGSWALSDFGLAVEVERATRITPVTRFGMGTEHYSAPEQLTHAFNATIRSDVYSLGKVLQHLVTGQRPVSPDMPGGVFRPVIEKAIAARPDDRYGSVESFLGAVHRAGEAEDSKVWESAEDTAKRLLERVRLPKPAEPDLEAFINWAASLDGAAPEDMEILTRVLPWLQAYAVRILWRDHYAAFRNVFARFAAYIGTARFSFDFTDVLASFTRTAAVETGDVGILREAITALCELGYFHNRWAVRATVTGLLQDVREPAAAVAAVEGLDAADDDAVQWTLSDFTLRTLHPHLRTHIEPYCSTGY
jgi:tRNA A-37 threonylcarbamoyl transferase component Bud32